MHIGLSLALSAARGGRSSAPSVAIPAGVLANQNMALVGDSRAANLTGVRQVIAGAAQKILAVESAPTEYATNGYSIRQCNGLDAGTDHVGEALAGSESIIYLITGYNDLGAIDLSAMQADTMPIFKRMNAVPVAVTSESGTFSRDTSGDYADWGDACSDGAGGTGVVTHVDGAGRIWLSEFSGLASGDTITCANSGYQATLDEDPPSHSGKLVVVASELPASYYADPASGATGAVHEGYGDWLETEPYDGLDLTYFRTVDAKSAALGTPTTNYPIPFLTGASDDGIHPNTEGGALSGYTAGPEIDAILENYDQVFPNDQTPPTGLEDMTAGVPFTGSASGLPTGWADGFSHPFATFSQVGDSGDADRELHISLSSTTNTAGRSCAPQYQMQPYELMDRDRYYRYGLEVMITNNAEDGPPVGGGNYFTVGIRYTLPKPGWLATQLRFRTAFMPQWHRILTPDRLVANGQGGAVTMQLYTFHENDAVIDMLVKFRRPRIWRRDA